MTLDLVLRTTAVLGLAWLLASLLVRATAATRHLVWHAAIIAVLAAPLLRPLVPELPIAIPAALGELREPGSQAWLTGSTVSSAAPPDARAAALANQPPLRVSAGATGTMPWQLLWAIGSAALGLWFAAGWLATWWDARRARPVPAGWQLELDTLRARLDIAGDVRLAMLADHVSPVAVGLWRPAILLPAVALGWSDDRRRAVLLHELAHIKRGDCRVHALGQVACAVYWFNPLVWKAFSALGRERERACDDAVIRRGAQASAYATHLLEIARDLQTSVRPTAALAMARPSELESRLLAVLATTRPRVPAPASRWAVAATLAAGTIGVLGASPARIEAVALPVTMAPAKSPPVYRAMIDAPTVGDRLATRRARTQASRTLASSESRDDREHAVLQLVASGDEEAIEPLQAALGDPDQDVREKAALGLALMSSPEVIPALLRALNDPDSQVREKAAIGLAYRRDARTVDALLQHANDPDSQVREKVAIALGTSGDPRAVAVLEGALNDPDAQVREKASAGLLLLSNSTGATPLDGENLRSGLRSIVSALARLAK